MSTTKKEANNQSYRHSTRNVQNIFTPKGFGLVEGECIERADYQIDNKLVDTISTLITQVLDIGWPDSDQFKKLLRTTIKEDVKNLAYQFLDFHVNMWVEDFNKEFDIDANASFDYAPHAKLWDLKEKLKEKLNSKK